MSFKWNNIDEVESGFSLDIIEFVKNYICEFYEIDSIDELTESQIKEIQKFCEKNKHTELMNMGLSEVIIEWENNQ